MKSSKSAGIFRPFEDLKILLKGRPYCLKKDSFFSKQISSESKSDPAADLAVFKEAMADVKKIRRDNCTEKNSLAPNQLNYQKKVASEPLMQLESLVKNGAGFVVAHTPEYMEGKACNINPTVTERLHRGDFSIQGHIDLHGLSVNDAHQVFENFLKESIACGKRMVLVIHGRGLSSPAEPILKTKIYEWLTGGPWRKWVIAFSSARWCDGGAGATYVLLRQRPLPKRFRKKWKPE